MTELEVRAAIKLHGWSFIHRKRRARCYIYAARKVRGQRIEHYISPTTKLAHLTSDQLSAKLEIVVQPIVVSTATPETMSGALGTGQEHGLAECRQYEWTKGQQAVS